MYIGGMQTTPRATKAPARTEEPPGTTRTPSPAAKRRAGKVCLSTNERPVAGISSSAPRRNPSRMPRLTQAFTRQREGEAASGSAARTSPASSAERSARNPVMAAASPMAAGPAAKCRSISCSSWLRFMASRVYQSAVDSGQSARNAGNRVVLGRVDGVEGRLAARATVGGDGPQAEAVLPGGDHGQGNGRVTRTAIEVL